MDLLNDPSTVGALRSRETGPKLPPQPAAVLRCRSVNQGWSRSRVLASVDADRRALDSGDVLGWFEAVERTSDIVRLEGEA